MSTRRAKMPAIEQVHAYTNDLSDHEKSSLTIHFIDQNTLQVSWVHFSEFKVTMRKQDLFMSRAQVVVNAANTYLGGGGGIDGAIHAKGGVGYIQAHRALREAYHSQYVSGYAAMIESGSLKEDCSIDNVIVVAGPQGEPNAEKESALYSCYFNSLSLAHQQHKTSIAFPSISTGIFRFPKDRAAAISLKAIYDFINHSPNTELKTISIHVGPTAPESVVTEYQKAAS